MSSWNCLAVVGHERNVNEKEERRYIDTAELAATLGMSEHTIKAWRKFRIITPIKFGRSVRWLLSDVLEELAKKGKFK